MLSGRGSGPRLSSFPLISGDTYRSIADVYLEEDSNLSLLAGRLTTGGRRQNLLFCEVSRVGDLVALASKNSLRETTVVVHNGDDIPVELVKVLSRYVRRIFCVNWLGSHEYALPIPIGLENVRINMNGRPESFAQNYPEQLPDKVSKFRRISCFQAFNVATNYEERKDVAQVFSGLKDSVTFTKSIPRRIFNDHISNSKFVISPPGNGPDCHRTWEAMYAGAVPVVLSRSWPFGNQRLPVLAVTSWKEGFEILRRDLEGLYSDIWANADTSLLYFPSQSRLILDDT